MSREPYHHGINRAIALIDRQIGEDLSIQRLADEAGISRFHFHRIFSAMVGESVHAMTTRLRMQRALMLAHRGGGMQWKAISAEVGYRSPDVFARAFKRHFGCAPSKFQLEEWWRTRPDREAVLNVSQYYLREAPSLPADFRVELVRRPAADLVINRVTGGYLNPGKLIAGYERMRDAAGELGVPLPERLSGASQDDPELVALSRCRYDFALEVPAGTRVPAGFLPGARAAGRWATLRVVGDMQALDLAWNSLFKQWLPASGLGLRAAPAEEIYHRTPEELGWERFDLTLAIPVED